MVGFVVTMRLVEFEAVCLGPIVLIAMRSLPVDLVGFIDNVLFTFGGIVRTVFGLNEVDEIFTTEFGVVDVPLINFIVLIGNFIGMVLAVLVVEFLAIELLDVNGVGDVDLVVVEFEVKVEVKIDLNVTFDGLADIVVVFGVVVLINAVVEITVFIGVDVTIAFGVVVNMVDVTMLVFCIPWLLSFISIDGVVISSETLSSDDTSFNGVVVRSDSVDSPNKFLDQFISKRQNKTK